MQSNEIPSNQRTINSTAETKKMKSLTLVGLQVGIFPVRENKKYSRNELEKKNGYEPISLKAAMSEQ